MPALRVAASLAMLALLLPRLRHVLPALDASSAGWLLAAVAVTVVGIVLSALRWQRVLAVLDLPGPLPALTGHYLAGLFVGNFLPSTIGGDVLRVTRLSGHNGDRPGTFASVVLERLTGWLVLPVLSLVSLAINPRLLGTEHWGLLPVVSVVTLALLSAILVAAGHPGLGRRLDGNESWLRFVAAVNLGLARARRHRVATAEVLVAGFGYQVAVVLAAFLGAKGLGIGVSWSAMLAVMPAVAMLQVLPVTIGGLGLREGALVLFLAHANLGVTTNQAIALGLTVYALNLVASLLGAPAFAFGGRPARATC